MEEKVYTTAYEKFITNFDRVVDFYSMYKDTLKIIKEIPSKIVENSTIDTIINIQSQSYPSK
jgi:hypothetical protein